MVGSRVLFGQAHVRRGLLLVIAVACIVLPPLASGGARDLSPAESLRSEGAQLDAKSHSVVLELYALQSALDRAEARLGKLKHQAQAVRKRREDMTLALGIARRDHRVAEQGLAARLRQLYAAKEVSPIEVLLGARSFDEAIASLDQIERVASFNDEVLEELESAQRHLTSRRRALVKCEERLAVLVRDAEATASRLAAAKQTRTTYLAELTAQRQLNAREVSRLEAQASAATVRSEQLVQPVPSAAPTSFPSGGVAVTGRQLTVSVTAYSLPGHTASGLPVGWGIVAVDPRLIPLGTRMYVPGYGEAIAADVGTAILGPKLDIWFPTLAQAQAWGLRVVTITFR